MILFIGDIIILVPCPSLTDPNNGIITCSLGDDDGVPSYENTCNFTCNTGYELTGSPQRTCQSDGSWNGSSVSGESFDCVSTGKCNRHLVTELVIVASSDGGGSDGIVIGVASGGSAVFIVLILLCVLVLVVKWSYKKHDNDNVVAKYHQDGLQPILWYD